LARLFPGDRSGRTSSRGTMSTRTARWGSRDRGSATAEFAIMVPALVLLDLLALLAHHLVAARMVSDTAAHAAASAATLECTADLSQLIGLGLPGTTTVEGDATSVVDTYRSTP